MDRDENVHFHIRWSGKETLDWQRFLTYAEAEESEKQLALPREGYSIEEYHGACPRCRDGEIRPEA